MRVGTIAIALAFFGSLVWSGLELLRDLSLQDLVQNLFKKSGYTPVMLKEPVQKRVI
jgi:hypothetical protein